MIHAAGDVLGPVRMREKDLESNYERNKTPAACCCGECMRSILGRNRIRMGSKSANFSCPGFAHGNCSRFLVHLY